MQNKKDFVIRYGNLEKYNGKDSVVEIPSNVKRICDEAFADCENLTSITIPSSVISIDGWAFQGCTSLTNIVIPNSITDIDPTAFEGTPWLKMQGDWLIINSILILYQGNTKNVIIPDSVTSIGDYAFHCCTNLTSITIPSSVTSIGEYAFGDCKRLKNITLPDSVTSIGDYAFDRCRNLTSVVIPNSVTSIGDEAFRHCENLKNITFPNSITSIGYYVFGDCKRLKNITLPDSVTSIGNCAFNGCECLTSIVIPDSVTSIGYCAFEYCDSLEHFIVKNYDCKLDLNMFGKRMPPKLKDDFFPLYPSFTDSSIKRYLLYKKYWRSLDDTQKVELFFARHSETLIPQYLDCVTSADVKKFGEALLAHIDEKARAKDCALAATLMTVFIEKLPASIMQQLYNALGKSKNGKKTLEKLNGDTAVMAALNASKRNQKELSPAEKCFDEILAAQETSRKNVIEIMKDYYGLIKSDLPKMSYSDGSAVDPVVFAFLLQVHEKKQSTYLYEAYKEPGICSEAAKMVSFLNQKSFQNALRELALNNFVRYQSGKKPNLANPICRYADNKLMEELTALAPKWRTVTSGDNAPMFRAFRRACIYSNERSAMLFTEKYGDLDYYAKLRGTTADTLRDTLLSDFGLNADGEKSYDIGGTTLTVSLKPDLTLSLFDESKKKIVKSIPKKDNNEKLVASASADFSELKKNIKKVAKSRCDNLFEDFLTGKEKMSVDWQNAYLINPLLRQIANLLVWSQGNKTFTLSGKNAICADGTPYTITNSPIKLAHPMEMKKTDIKSWQLYLNSNGLKQPFIQIWEPVYNLRGIDKNRYNRSHIPAYRFSNQDKHGIYFNFDYGLSELYIALKDCEIDYENGTAVERHYLDMKGDIILGNIVIKKKSRYANHVVSMLDKWTVFGRIIKDDISVIDQLGNATIAQIMEYIQVANENNAINVTAALLEYKNKHFADFDPMDEFVL